MALVEDSFARIEASTSRIAALPFDSTRRFSHAVLSSNLDFERHCIREAEAHELSLFRVTGQQPQQAVQSQLQRLRSRKSLAPASSSSSSLDQTISANLQWPAPSPVKKAKKGATAAEAATGSSSHAHEAQRLLLAAERLLQIYPLAKESEHVSHLKNRLQRLQDAIEQDEDYLSSLGNPLASEEEPDLEVLQAALKSEELEVIALRVQHEEHLQDQARKKQQARAAREAKRRQDEASAAQESERRRHSDQTEEVNDEHTLPTDPSSAPAEPTAQLPAPQVEPSPTPQCAFSDELLNRISVRFSCLTPNERGEKLYQSDSAPFDQAKLWTVLRDSLSALCQVVACEPDNTFSSTVSALSAVVKPSTALESMPEMHQAELYLLLVFLCALKGQESAALSPDVPLLPLHLLDRPPAVLALDPSRLFCTADHKMGLVSMAKLKEAASTWACGQRGWGSGWGSGEMPTKAIYGLVAKGLLKIDRRTIKDPKIYFDPSPT